MFELQEVPEAEKRLLEKVAELEDKNSELLDKYRRSLADFENLRNRNRVHSFLKFMLPQSVPMGSLKKMPANLIWVVNLIKEYLRGVFIFFHKNFPPRSYVFLVKP